MEDHTFDLDSGLYLRVAGHPIINKLGDIIAKTYRNPYPACLFPSGMAALTTSIFAMAESRKKSPGRFIFSSEMFSDTLLSLYPLIDTHTPHQCEMVDVWDRDALQDILKKTSPEIHAFIVESASNPRGKAPQWDLIPDWTTLIVDNSWLSPYLFNPFNYGADIVIESMTKYWNAGKRFGGHVLCKGKKMTQRIQRIAKAFGMHVPPNHISEMISLQADLLERMKYLSNLMESHVLPFLKSNSKVLWVNVWKCPDSSNHFKYPGAVYFIVKSKKSAPQSSRERKEKWREWCNGLSIKAATSYGKAYDLVDHWTKGEGNEIHVRLSLGYTPNPNLLDDLEILIHRIQLG